MWTRAHGITPRCLDTNQESNWSEVLGRYWNLSTDKFDSRFEKQNFWAKWEFRVYPNTPLRYVQIQGGNNKSFSTRTPRSQRQSTESPDANAEVNASSAEEAFILQASSLEPRPWVDPRFQAWHEQLIYADFWASFAARETWSVICSCVRLSFIDFCGEEPRDTSVAKMLFVPPENGGWARVGHLWECPPPPQTMAIKWPGTLIPLLDCVDWGGEMHKMRDFPLNGVCKTHPARGLWELFFFPWRLNLLIKYTLY